MEITVATYNIHKGFSRGNRHFVLANIRRALREIDADIVFLQEVLGEHRRHQRKISNWPTVEHAAFLAEERWPHFVYGPNAFYPDGHHGNAILSKFPILSSNNTDISVTRLQRRGLLQIQLALPGREEPLDCVCVHLDFSKRGRQIQLSRIASELIPITKSDKPFILAGDFNDWRRRATMALLSLGATEVYRTTHGGYGKTFPSKLPLLALDRVYYRGFDVIEAQVRQGLPWKNLSDHLPLVSKLYLSD